MKIVSVIGTRPQYVKAAVVTRALRDHGRFEEITVDTGQHYDKEMSGVLLDDLPDVQPARNLNVHGEFEGEVIASTIDAVTDVLKEEQPDAVLVYGDTNSTLAGALAASSVGIPVGHVEAGLRSFNEAMREERNRVRVDHLSEWLFCPTPTAVANLEKEGVTRNVHHVGDVMYDAALRARERVEALGPDHFNLHDHAPGENAVATLHRAETTDDPEKLRQALEYLEEEAGKLSAGIMRFPVHPRTRKAIDAAGLGTGHLLVMDPVGYLEMTHLVITARAVYTDSGGLQKEAYFHRVPCVTLRSETEWCETIDAGWNRLWNEPDYRARREILDYGDGHAGRHVVEVLAQELGVR